MCRPQGLWGMQGGVELSVCQRWWLEGEAPAGLLATPGRHSLSARSARRRRPCCLARPQLAAAGNPGAGRTRNEALVLPLGERADLAAHAWRLPVASLDRGGPAAGGVAVACGGPQQPAWLFQMGPGANVGDGWGRKPGARAAREKGHFGGEKVRGGNGGGRPNSAYKRPIWRRDGTRALTSSCEPELAPASAGPLGAGPPAAAAARWHPTALPRISAAYPRRRSASAPSSSTLQALIVSAAKNGVNSAWQGLQALVSEARKQLWAVEGSGQAGDLLEACAPARRTLSRPQGT